MHYCFLDVLFPGLKIDSNSIQIFIRIAFQIFRILALSFKQWRFSLKVLFTKIESLLEVFAAWQFVYTYFKAMPYYFILNDFSTKQVDSLFFFRENRSRNKNLWPDWVRQWILKKIRRRFKINVNIMRRGANFKEAKTCKF